MLTIKVTNPDDLQQNFGASRYYYNAELSNEPLTSLQKEDWEENVPSGLRESAANAARAIKLQYQVGAIVKPQFRTKKSFHQWFTANRFEIKENEIKLSNSTVELEDKIERPDLVTSITFIQDKDVTVAKLYFGDEVNA